ncbi:helix-turn-helix domain-containing protein [Chloroflexota bacterium]
MSGLQPPDVGAQLRAMRKERGLSIRALAKICDLSPNTISLIERRITSPSVSTLHRLATALRVPIVAFFEEQPELVGAIHTRPGERARTGGVKVLLESLGSGLEGQILEAFVVTLSEGAGSGSHSMVHSGHELVYCLEGEVEYEVEGQLFQLEAGHSLLLEAHQPHQWRNPGPDEAVFVLVFEPATQAASVEEHLRVETG